MRVAWVTHRDIQSRAGGAEAADMDMLALRPEGIDVTLVKPGGIRADLKEYDRIVATGFVDYTARELNELSRLQPILWVHDAQFSGHWVYEEATKIIVLTPQHLEYELEKNPRLKRDQFIINPGWMNTSGMMPMGTKEHKALWAHRAEPHKGLDNAESWAKEHDVPLEVMVGRPHEEVIYEMARSEYFVLLSHIMDPGPRSVMEAQLCGCKIIANDKVGWFDEDLQDLNTRLSHADKAFWEAICE